MMRLLCWLGWHKPRPEIDPATSLHWMCCRCHDIQPGAYALRRKNR